MPNKKMALEWISFSDKNLDTAILLNKSDHFTDVIAIEVQQSVEKALKAIYAFNNERIPRTHSLEILFTYANSFVCFEEISKLDIAIISDYYESERYPGPRYFVPDRQEITHAIEVASSIKKQVNNFIFR